MKIKTAAFLLATLSIATINTSAEAGWGCGYRFKNLAAGNHGRVWAWASEKEARAGALKLCKSTPNVTGCYIVGCKVDIDTEQQAQALWPMTTEQAVCMGNGCK